MKSSATALDLTRKENGATTNAYHWDLSDEGKLLTSTATEFRPSGPVVTSQIVASRMSGSNNFAGQWQDTSYLRRHADMALKLDSHMLHISYPNAGQYIDAPFDGADVPVRGPHAPKGMTYAARMVRQREINTVAKRNGKAIIQGFLELSEDGRVITDSWWRPGQNSDRGTIVYEKK